MKNFKSKKNIRPIIKIKKKLCNFQNEKINKLFLNDNYFNMFYNKENNIKNQIINLTNN